jgi:hypothetical protein
VFGLAFQDRPRIRAGKLASALSSCGWEFDVLGLQYPTVYASAYRSVTADPFLTSASLRAFVAEHPARLLMVNNEPNWPMLAFAEASAGRPVVLDVADIQSQRGDGYIDPYEAEAFALARAYLFVTPDQREYAVEHHLADPAKPFAIVSNYVLAAEMIDGTPLPHVGGMVYQGGLNMRSVQGGWRDLSSLADALGGELHLYGDVVDYGVHHGTETVYPLLIQRLAQHDWGFVGSPVPSLAWEKTLPNKIYEYFAAGIPVVVMNAPLCEPFCSAGMGVYCDSVEEAAEVVRGTNPEPYRAAVAEQRGRFTMENHIAPVAELFDTLIGGLA